MRSCYENIFAHFVKYAFPQLFDEFNHLEIILLPLSFFFFFFLSLVDLGLFHWSALSSRSQAVKGSSENVPFVRDLPLYLLIYQPIKIHNSGHTLTCLAFLFLSIGWRHDVHCTLYSVQVFTFYELRLC